MRGFTMIELVIVMVIIGIVASVSAPLIYHAAEGSGLLYNISETAGQANVGFTQILLNLKDIDSAAAITTMTSTAIGFTNLDGDTVSISYNGTDDKVYRSENGGTARALLDNVTAFSFTYQDQNGTTTAVAADVRYVTVSVTITKDDVVRTFKDTVYLANYG